MGGQLPRKFRPLHQVGHIVQSLNSYCYVIQFTRDEHTPADFV